jgi:hypothetical protein
VLYAFPITFNTSPTVSITFPCRRPRVASTIAKAKRSCPRVWEKVAWSPHPRHQGSIIHSRAISGNKVSTFLAIQARAVYECTRTGPRKNTESWKSAGHVGGSGDHYKQ